MMLKISRYLKLYLKFRDNDCKWTDKNCIEGVERIDVVSYGSGSFSS